MQIPTMTSFCLITTTLLAMSFVSTESFVFPVSRTIACPDKRHAVDWTRQDRRPVHMSLKDDLPARSEDGSKLPMLLDPGTKGGALFLSFLLFMVPIIVYQIVTGAFGVDGIEAGKWIGVGFTFFTTVLWVSTYIFRVATKDMTYAKQLKDYENAVIAKRLEELDDDEIQALVEDIERDEF